MIDRRTDPSAPVRCCGVMARACSLDAVRSYRLAGIRDAKPLCGACRQSAENAGLDPRPVPTWLDRGQGKDLTGATRVA